MSEGAIFFTVLFSIIGLSIISQLFNGPGSFID